MCRCALSFHFTPDPLLDMGDVEPAVSPPSSVEIPPGPSVLAVCARDGPRLLPVEHRDPGHVSYVVEPLVGKRRPQLALFAREGAEPVRVNGLPAPSVALLEPGDQVQLGRDVVLHVSLFRRPFVGVAGAKHQDKTCPVCRARVAAEDVIYVCANCETVMHLESKPPDGQDPLECALISASCPFCGWDVVMTEGFTHRLEL